MRFYNPNKSEEVNELINEALEILEALGVPLDLEPTRKRRLEKMAMAFLAVADVKKKGYWVTAKSVSDKHSMRSRDIIRYINENFEDNISSGSYDDIRRKDLVSPVEAGIILKAANNQSADTNDGTRGYALESSCAAVIRSYGSSDWDGNIKEFMKDRLSLSNILKMEREQRKIPIKISDEIIVLLDSGPHNILQKAIIDDFLPRFAGDVDVLYIGDTSEKQLFRNQEKLDEINFKVVKGGRLPDILAYSKDKNWLYLIEAVYTSNPIDKLRHIELQRLYSECKAGIVFVTAFLDLNTFRKFCHQISWETEVWIADDPSHLIHYNGDRFLGPHKQSSDA